MTTIYRSITVQYQYVLNDPPEPEICSSVTKCHRKFLNTVLESPNNDLFNAVSFGEKKIKTHENMTGKQSIVGQLKSNFFEFFNFFSKISIFYDMEL